MAERNNEELQRLLEVAEEVQLITISAMKNPTDSGVAGFGIGILADLTEIKGLIAGVHYALGVDDPLVSELLDKGSQKFHEDKQAERVRFVQIIKNQFKK